MQLIKTFTVSAPADRTWAAVTDLHRIADCLPGFALTGTHGDRGGLGWSSSVTLGPVKAKLEGTARLVGRDDASHHAVISAHGSDLGSQGDATATVDLQLHSSGTGSEVVLSTDLQLTGRMAQVGRGVIAGIGGKLIGQFAQRLESSLAADSAPPNEPSTPAQTSEVDVRPTAEISHAVDTDDDVHRSVAAPVGGGVPVYQLRYAVAVATGVLGLVVGLLVGRRTGHRVGSGWNR